MTSSSSSSMSSLAISFGSSLVSLTSSSSSSMSFLAISSMSFFISLGSSSSFSMSFISFFSLSAWDISLTSSSSSSISSFFISDTFFLGSDSSFIGVSIGSLLWSCAGLSASTSALASDALFSLSPPTSFIGSAPVSFLLGSAVGAAACLLAIVSFSAAGNSLSLTFFCTVVS